MESSKNDSFVVKRYAVREAKKWRYTVREAKIGQYAVRDRAVLIYIDKLICTGFFLQYDTVIGLAAY